MKSEAPVAEGVVTEGEIDKMRADWRARLEAEHEAGQAYKPNKADWLDGRWAGLPCAHERSAQRARNPRWTSLAGPRFHPRFSRSARRPARPHCALASNR